MFHFKSFKTEPGRLFIVLFILKLLWFSIFCWNFGECPIPAVLAACPAPLQRDLGTFWSWVWCEEAPRDWQKGIPCVVFQHLLPVQAMKSGFIPASVPGNEHPGLGRKIFYVLQCWKSLANPGFTLSWKYRDAFQRPKWDEISIGGWFSSCWDSDLFMTIYCSGFLLCHFSIPVSSSGYFWENNWNRCMGYVV